MRPEVKGAVTALVCAAAVSAAAGIVFMWSGMYNISAKKEHWAVTKWVLHQTMERSVGMRAALVHPPQDYEKTALTTGFGSFDRWCVGCHGAPGVENSPIGKGLNPAPPDLAKVDPDFTPSAIWWIARNGIKMTGMPSFEGTLSDSELWSAAAFVRELRTISPERYRQLRLAQSGGR